MDRIMNLVKCSGSDASLLYGSMTSKTLLKVPRWLWSLLLLCFITVNALFIAMCLSVDTSSILHYKSYDCKYIDEAAPSIIEYKGADSSSTYYYYVLNITMYHDDAGANGQDLTVLPSILWDDFCKTPTSEESKKCMEEYIGSDHDDSFTCYAVQSNVEKFATKKINSVGGNSINISVGKEMTQSYISELYWTIPLALVIVLIIIVGYILFGFFYFEGRSKFSLDRFIRQVIKDPFMLSGDSTTYRLEESSSMNVILQDPTERHKEVLLRLDKRALALSAENEEDEEPISQLQEIALSSLDTNDDGNKVHPVYLLMRSTATEEHETLLYYERPSTENMKRSRKSTLRMLLILWILIIPTFFIMFILAILSLVLLESIIIALCLWELSIIIVFFITHTSLVKLIPVYQGIHYLITSSRVVIVETLPLKLGYTLYCITHDKIGQVWHGSLNESHPTTHVTLEDRKEGQLLAEIKTNKDEAVNGILFEYCTDVRSSIDLIEHRQGNSSNFSIE